MKKQNFYEKYSVLGQKYWSKCQMYLTFNRKRRVMYIVPFEFVDLFLWLKFVKSVKVWHSLLQQSYS